MIIQSASVGVVPNRFLYSSTGSPIYFTEWNLNTPSASLRPLLLALTQACRVILNPNGSLNITTGCKWPMTRNLQPTSGGEGQACPWKRPTVFQNIMPSEVLIF